LKFKVSDFTLNFKVFEEKTYSVHGILRKAVNGAPDILNTICDPLVVIQHDYRSIISNLCQNKTAAVSGTDSCKISLM
jgi:hypothetical protein